jgi:hypothetical protein
MILRRRSERFPDSLSDIISQPFLIERTAGLRGTRPVSPVEALIEGELRFRLDISTHSSFPLLTR